MDSVPLIPKAKILPNLDTLPVIKELFQNEFELALRHGSSKHLSKTILTSFQYKKVSTEEKSVTSINSAQMDELKRENLLSYSENIFQAYSEHEKELQCVLEAERNVFTANAEYLKRKMIILENKTLQELFLLKRQPHMKSLDMKHVSKFKLLQNEAALPPSHQAHSDFRVQNFGKWKKRLESFSQDSVITNYIKKGPEIVAKILPESCLAQTKNEVSKETGKKRKSRPKKTKVKIETEVFRAEPKIVFFTDYNPGDVYVADIEVKNIHTKGMQFQVKPMSPEGPFFVYTKNEVTAKKLFPGLSFQLTVEFSPKSMDVIAEDIYIAIEEDRKLLIPLVAYLEPPILKTHKDINEFTKNVAEKIGSSCIECGSCFTGDTKVTKLRLKCFRGSGEFFVMSCENWNRSYVNSVTNENLLEIPPFRVYPVYFKIEKSEAIDLFIEFTPKNSGTHVENIIIACDNGEVRSLDLLADAIGWHSYFFSFQDELLKELPVDMDDDMKVKYYINFKDTTPSGKVEKNFSISNNSEMAFEFQWKIREANISSVRNKYLKLGKFQVRVKPENGTLEPNSVREFNVQIKFDNADPGDYRMVLSLYVLNLPYQCIEEDNTIIQPTGLVRNLYSQCLYGEEEYTTPSPELLSLQGTYETLQDSIKSYVEYQSKTQFQSKNDFCRTTCIPNPGLCAKPLKKSKTYFNIGDEEGLSCFCKVRAEETNSDSCVSNANDKTTELSGPKNEVIWDFVDILVDEVELWVNVGPLKVTMEPCVMDFTDSLVVNNAPIFKELRITNHSQSPAKCKWIHTKEESNIGNPSVVIVYDNSDINTKITQSSVSSDSGRENSSKPCTEYSGTSKNENLKNDNANWCEFIVPGWSTHVCSIGVSVAKPGNFRKNLILTVCDNNLQLKLIIQGRATGKYFSASPFIMNFRLVKQGTRLFRDYEIKNESSEPLFLNAKEFTFSSTEEKFFDLEAKSFESDETKNFWLNKYKTASRAYYLDARVPGIKVSLLEIYVSKPVVDPNSNQYVLVLGDVRIPSLQIYTPRFGNAILAPAGMMYVGQVITCTVTLKNKGNLHTVFTWGHAFGCHSRKIKVDIHPKSETITCKGKLSLKICLTPLDEGIIDHCYIPCFFCRSSEPLVLSIVGIVEKMKVTFEIISENGIKLDQGKAATVPPYGTALRIHWPVKVYDPNLGQSFISEVDVLAMKCRCHEVEKEAESAFDKDNQEPVCTPVESPWPKDNNITTIEISKDIAHDKQCKFPPDEHLHDSPSRDSAATFKKITETNSIQKFGSHETLMDDLQLLKAELEFLNITCHTTVTKQFVIRNETPVPTKFQIYIKNFGKCKGDDENRISIIKNKVFGHPKDKMWKVEQPLILTVTPSEGDLLGHEAVCINVAASGNTWGEYRDFIVCHIKGIPVFNLKVFVQLVGHPFYFPMFENHPPGKPVLRFQPISHVSEPVSKKIRVVNRCSIPITISWLIFLTQPLTKEEAQEESFNLCLESNVNLDSNHSEESTKSVKVYLPKNMSESSSTFRNMLEMRDFSQNSGTLESFGKGEAISEKFENNEIAETADKVRQDCNVPSPTEAGGSDSQKFLFCIDIHNFQVEPKEVNFEPFEEKKLIVSFNPRFCKLPTPVQEFKAVLTGCVKLRPTDEKSPGLYYRPSGMNFLSEILDFSAIVETPVVSFDILRGDLRFHVDANDVIKSSAKKLIISRTFFFKNNSQKSIPLKIEISPGSIFTVNTVETINELHKKYDPEVNQLKVETGQLLQVELECSVTYKGVIYAYEQLKLSRRKELNATYSDDVNASKSTEEEKVRGKRRAERNQPWCQYFNNSRLPSTAGNSSLEARDSFNINLNRMSSKSNNSICYDYSEPGYYNEAEGEFLGLPSMEEAVCRPKIFQHIIVLEEEINFVQPGLMTQTLTAELHLSFPALKISPKSLDMGNVYIGETGIRYCSIINLTGTPTDFKVKPKCKVNEFVVKPLTGNLPSSNYNSDVGTTITVEFKPQQPGQFVQVFQIYCNTNMEFDCHELAVTGNGTWNEKYKKIKFESGVRLPGVSPQF